MSKETENKKSNKKVDNTKVAKTKAKDKKAVKENIKEAKILKEERIIEEEFNYNEDLDEVIEVIEEDVKPAKKETKKISLFKKKEKKNDDSIKIEQVPSKKKIEKKTKKCNFGKKLEKLLVLFEKHHVAIYSFVAGVLITTLIVIVMWPDRIATLKNGEQSIVKVNGENYTANELYEDMKDYYSVSLLLDDIDNNILTELYPEDKKMLEDVESNAEYYFNMYEQYYGYTQEQFLSQNGFSSYEAFLDYLKLDYRRNKYLDNYIKKNLSDEEIKEYYEENVFGDINTQHVLVAISSEEGGKTDEEAKALAEKIITKLNDGTSWEEIQKKYKDDITFEDLGYQSWDASLEKSFMDALEDMDDNSYSEEPVKTSYGYHVIYRLDQKKTPSLKDVKETIINNLIADEKAEDANLLFKSLINLRKEKNIKFNDTVMAEKYSQYCKQYK